MNKVRRAALAALSEKLEEIEAALEELKEEEEYRDNMPENLQGSERYEAADYAANEIDTAMCCLLEARNSIESASE